MKRLVTLLTVMALVAVACGGADSDAQALSADCVAGEAEGTLNLYNWTEYTPTGVLAEEFEVTDFVLEFEERTGVDLVLTEYESNEAMLAQIDAGVPYDLIVPSDYMVSIMKSAGLLVKLNRDALPNIANLDPGFTDLPYDSGNEYSIPYQWGTTGIGFNYDVVDDTDGVSWGILFDPAQSVAHAGRITLLDDERETMGAALKYLGYSLNSTSEAEIDEAAALIKAAKDNVAAFMSSGYDDLMITGETDVAMGWNGDFLAGYDEASTDDFDAYEQFGYAIPIEGAAAWVDTMAIPTTASNPCAAHAFIDMVLEPFMGAELTNYNYYASPNLASQEFIYDEILEDPAIYPPQEMLEDGTLEFFADLGEFGQYLSDAYADAKS